MSEDKRFTVAVYDSRAIGGYAVIDLSKYNPSLRLKYENVFIGSEVACEIVCKAMNNLVDEYTQLEKENEDLKHEISELKEVVESIETDRNHNLMICKSYEKFIKSKGFDIRDVIGGLND